MPDSDELLGQDTVDFRREEREAANRGDGLDAPPAEDADDREQIVAGALERFFGGNPELAETEEPG